MAVLYSYWFMVLKHLMIRKNVALYINVKYKVHERVAKIFMAILTFPFYWYLVRFYLPSLFRPHSAALAMKISINELMNYHFLFYLLFCIFVFLTFYTYRVLALYIGAGALLEGCKFSSFLPDPPCLPPSIHPSLTTSAAVFSGLTHCIIMIFWIMIYRIKLGDQ